MITESKSLGYAQIVLNIKKICFDCTAADICVKYIIIFKLLFVILQIVSNAI